MSKPRTNAAAGGRPSIYRGKVKRYRVQGILTPAGWRAWKAAKSALAKEHGLKVRDVSDGDLVEDLSRRRQQ